MKKYMWMVVILSSFAILLEASNSQVSLLEQDVDEMQEDVSEEDDDLEVGPNSFLPVEEKIHYCTDASPTKLMNACVQKALSCEEQKRAWSFFIALRDKNPFLFYRAISHFFQFPLLNAESLFFAFTSLLQRPPIICKKIQDVSVEFVLYKEGDSFVPWREAALPEFFKALQLYIETKVPSEVFFETELKNKTNPSESYKNAVQKQQLANENFRERARMLMNVYKERLENLSNNELCGYIDTGVGLRFCVDKKNSKMALALYVQEYEKGATKFDPLASKLSARMDDLCVFFIQELIELRNRLSAQPLFCMGNNDSKILCKKFVQNVPSQFFFEIPASITHETKESFSTDALDSLNRGFCLLDNVFVRQLDKLYAQNKIELTSAKDEIKRMHERIYRLMQQFAKLKNELPSVFCNYLLGAHPFVLRSAIRLEQSKEQSEFFFLQFYAKLDKQKSIKAFLKQAAEEVVVLLSQKELEPQQKPPIKKEDLATKYGIFSGGFKRKWINPREL